MSFAKVYSAQISLLQAHIIDIEVDISRGLHAFSMVGLPNKAVEEARDRISAAIKNSGFTSPKQKNQKVVVSLAPADIKKEGPHFDLGIALGYLKAAGEISFRSEEKLFLGELSLDGDVRRVNGVLSLVLEAERNGFSEVFVPEENAEEAALAEKIRVYKVGSLVKLIRHLRGENALERQVRTDPALYSVREKKASVIFSDIVGQENAKRVLTIAAAGRHNVMLYGPPGTGKTMLAKAFQSILPKLSYKEMIEVTAIHSSAGSLGRSFITSPPARSPHHTSSSSAIIGGGTKNIGEITLAHRGLLFMDEFPEFDRRILEALRQPLEERSITIARAKGTITLPADFILIATMNPCPCGYLGSKNKMCTCTANSIQTYRKKISGPICDRIDLWVKVDNEKSHARSKNASGGVLETESLHERVAICRKIWTERQRTEKDGEWKMAMTPRSMTILSKAVDRLALSMRGRHRTMKIARTIADLAGEEKIGEEHVLEALQYRAPLDY